MPKSETNLKQILPKEEQQVTINKMMVDICFMYLFRFGVLTDITCSNISQDLNTGTKLNNQQ